MLNCIFRAELDPEDYEETKQETMDQLKELNDSLSKLVKGDISLVSALGAVQLVKNVNPDLVLYPNVLI